MSTVLPKGTMGETHLVKNDAIWDKHNIISDAQHCRSERECSAVLFHIQAALETAYESGTDIYMSSWDIQRSYDSPPTKDSKLAWMRLGIQLYKADHLIPYTAWKKKLRKEIPPTKMDKDLPQPFKDDTRCQSRSDTESDHVASVLHKRGYQNSA